MISVAEWRSRSTEFEQRVNALNVYSCDAISGRRFSKPEKIPTELIVDNDAFVPEMVGVYSARGICSHIIGAEIVRTGNCEFCVLEDKTRTSSSRRHVSSKFRHATSMATSFPGAKVHRRSTKPGLGPGVDGLGWFGFDASNLTFPSERCIRLAYGPDAATAAPLRGLGSGGQNEALDVVVEVEQQGSQQ
jgi:hypothetical protein